MRLTLSSILTLVIWALREIFQKSKILYLALLAGFIATGLAMITSYSVDVKAQESTVPEWIKNVAQFWSSDQISDQEFVNSMEFLVDEGIMEIPSSVKVAQAEDITKSISELEGRMDRLEETSSGELTEYQKAPIVEESFVKDIGENSGDSYVSTVCPYDKVRHFDTVLFRFWASTQYPFNHPSDFEYSDDITIIAPEFEEVEKDTYKLEQRSSEVLLTFENNHNLEEPVLLREKIKQILEKNSEDYIGIEEIEIRDVEHSVICANSPPTANIDLIGKIYK